MLILIICRGGGGVGAIIKDLTLILHIHYRQTMKSDITINHWSSDEMKIFVKNNCTNIFMVIIVCLGHYRSNEKEEQ